MKAKRKRHSPALKAKVGLDALMGIKTVAQIARENNVHPMQVSQWKTIVRERLPDLFDSDRKEAQNQEELIAALHQKIGQLTIDLDWLKKNPNSWVSKMSRNHRPRLSGEPASAMRVDGPGAQHLLLRAMPGDARELAAHAPLGRVASGPSGLWEPQTRSEVEAGRMGCQSQASDAPVASDGNPSHLSQAQFESARGRPRLSCSNHGPLRFGAVRDRARSMQIAGPQCLGSEF